jgi:hypothetical protein
MRILISVFMVYNTLLTVCYVNVLQTQLLKVAVYKMKGCSLLILL